MPSAKWQPLLYPLVVRRLIINADDFGLTAGVNRGIAEAHGHGVVTSATLMANGPAFDDAVRLAQSAPRLGIGCHVVLVDGSPVLETGASRLLDRSHPPRFPEGISSFALRALTGRLDPSQIEAEVIAQVRRLQSAGIAVTHLDSHKHTHMFGQVLRPLLRAARACGIRAVRNPFERIQVSLARKPALWMRSGEVAALRSFAGSFHQTLREMKMVTPDGTVGIVVTGMLNQELFRQMMQNLPEGTWELVCHPGYNDDQLQSIHTRLRRSRAEELRILTSSVAREVLTRAGIELISYRDLA